MTAAETRSPDEAECAALMSHASVCGAQIGDLTAEKLPMIRPGTRFEEAFRFEMLGLAYLAVRETEATLADWLAEDDRQAWRIRALDVALSRIGLATLTNLAAGSSN